MKKRIIHLLWILVLCIVFINPLQVNANAMLDVNTKCTLEITYAKENDTFENLDIRIYRVAKANVDGTFDLIDPYADFPVNIHGVTSQKEWKDIATTLNSYILSEQVYTYQRGVTDTNGKIRFHELETGLYLVSGVIAKNEDKTYIFESFMVYLPSFTKDGSFHYNVISKPKCSEYLMDNEPIDYKVVKLWKDSANPQNRPNAVNVEIFKDGNPYHTVVLDKNNNWSYTWTAMNKNEQWTVVEKDVPKEYKVTISNNNTTFIITNILPSHANTSPSTGDTTSLGFYIIIMCISGFLLVIIGIKTMNGERNGKNR